MMKVALKASESTSLRARQAFYFASKSLGPFRVVHGLHRILENLDAVLCDSRLLMQGHRERIVHSSAYKNSESRQLFQRLLSALPICAKPVQIIPLGRLSSGMRGGVL